MVGSLGASGSNKNLFDNPSNSTNILGSGGKLPGATRAPGIESRKGILSRKSSVNKNSFYNQKSRDKLPNKLYGGGAPNSGIGNNMGSSGGNRGPSSYFNKNGG